MKKIFRLGEAEHRCSLRRGAEGLVLETDAGPLRCALLPLGAARHRLSAGDEQAEALIARHGERLWVRLRGRTHVIEAVDPLDALAAASRHGGDGAQAPMPGTIVSVLVQPGAEVKAGQDLVVMESMKLEVTIRAPHDGRIAAVHCAPGDQVPPKFTLVRFATAEGSAPEIAA